MTILAESTDTFSDVSMTLSAWVISFISCLAGLFISLFLLISHDDLQSNFIQPVELSNNLSTVRYNHSFNFNLLVLASWIHLLSSQHAATYLFRSMVHSDCRYSSLRVQCPQLPQKRIQSIFHYKERILREVILKNGKSV